MLGWLGVGACISLLIQVFTVPAAPRVTATCDPTTTPLVAVDGVLRCAAPAACDDAPVRSGDAFTRTTEGCATRTGRMSPVDLESLAIPVDVSTASADELASLPGIGPELARRIAAARPFGSVDELLRVDGIGPVRLAAMRSRVLVGPQ